MKKKNNIITLLWGWVLLCLTQYLNSFYVYVKVVAITGVVSALKMTCFTQKCVNALPDETITMWNDDIASYIEIKDEIY